MDKAELSKTMKAVWIAKFGGPEGLQIRNVDKPQPVADQILVRVRASALNRADLLQRQGHYPAPAGYPQEIPGSNLPGEGPKPARWCRCGKPGKGALGLTAAG